MSLRATISQLGQIAGAIFLCLALLAWLGRLAPDLDPLANLAVLGVAGGLAALCATLAGSVRFNHLWPALAAIAAWGALYSSARSLEGASRAAYGGSERLKVVQFNLGADSQKWRQRFLWINAQEADVVALQEVGPLGAALRSELLKRYPFETRCERQPHPCEVAVLSRIPPLEEGRLSEPNTAWARYASARGDYVVISTHVPRPGTLGAQPHALENLVALIKSLGRDKVILAGDFNASPYSAALQAFGRNSGLALASSRKASWPAADWLPPFIDIDHTFVGAQWSVAEAERGPALGSDHYPKVAILSRSAR